MINDEANNCYYFAVKNLSELNSLVWLQGKKEAIINNNNNDNNNTDNTDNNKNNNNNTDNTDNNNSNHFQNALNDALNYWKIPTKNIKIKA